MAKLNVAIPSVDVEVGGVKYRKVERSAIAGDIVKALESDLSDIDLGAFYSIVVVDGSAGFIDDGNDLRTRILSNFPEHFEVYEKVTEAPVKYREVKRKANVGDRIKIVAAGYAGTPSAYKNGESFTVTTLKGDDGVRINRKWRDSSDIDAWVEECEYVVLEPITEPPAPTQPERLKVGEYAKVVVTNGRSHINVGDIRKIVKDDRSGAPYYAEKLDGSDYDWFREEGLIRATDAEVASAKQALERTKAIGEFAEGGYAVVVVNAILSNASVTLRDNAGAFVKVTVTDGVVWPLIATLTIGGYGYCNADALRKITKEEYEAATKPGPTFNVGDYAKVIRNNHEHRVGHIVQVTGGKSNWFDFAVNRITHGGNGFIDAVNIEKLSEREAAEEIAKLAEEAQWAKIGRKVGEIHEGDVVQTFRDECGHATGTIGIAVSSGDAEHTRVRAGRGTPFHHRVKLIAPVESLFNAISVGGERK